MTDAPITEIIPIYTDTDNRMRVSGTRVLLDLIVYAYHQGETPEHIVQMYPTLSLDKVYLALGYYLRHQETVDTYIRLVEEEGKRLQQEIEARFPPTITRANLLARLNTNESD